MLRILTFYDLVKGRFLLKPYLWKHTFNKKTLNIYFEICCINENQYNDFCFSQEKLDFANFFRFYIQKSMNKVYRDLNLKLILNLKFSYEKSMELFFKTLARN